MKRLKSVLTDNMDRCYITGRTDHIERHHVFGGAYRKKSEKYGFVVPLTAEVHPNGAFFDISRDRKGIDRFLKRECQIYFEHHCGSREDFRREFGRSYL